jgi:hypothetical protein
MAITKDAGVQSPAVKKVDFTFADLGATTYFDNEAMGLPGGAIVRGGELVITIPFNSTTNVFTVGDKAVNNRFKAAIDAKVAALTALVPTGKVHNTANERALVINSAFTGVPPTTGAGYLIVEYIEPGRADFIQR